MAIDTENKRRSALTEGLLPVPDNDMTIGDRYHVTWFYRISDAAAVVTFPRAATAARAGVGGVTATRPGVGGSTVTRSGVGSSTVDPRTS